MAGGRDGHLVLLTGEQIILLRIPSASRAITGVATVTDRSVIYAGGFDGFVRAVLEDGSLLWEADLTGEVWSLSSNPSGGLLVAGTGDGRVVALNSGVGIDVAREIKSFMTEIKGTPPEGGIADVHTAFIDLMVRLGLFSFSLRFLVEQVNAELLDKSVFAELLEYLGERCDDEHPDAAEIYFERALRRRDQERHWDAAVMFLRAAKKETLRLRAYSEAASDFYKANHNAAALACFRRARQSVLTSADLHVVYTLARSFEDRGEKRVARDHLDMILVQNPDYRDASSRLTDVRGAIGFDTNTRIDYTGLTVNLLGPDAPSLDVDRRLKHIIEARAREMNITEAERSSYDSVMHEMFERGILSARTETQSVGYDASAYIRYDFGLPEDDVKKKLEAVNLVNILRKVKDVRKTLDVGSATGRYPGMLQSLGIESYGVDIEEEAIAFCAEKFAGRPSPNFSQGDVRRLVFDSNFFDFVSCMMGTFYHLPLGDQPLALTEMFRVCRPGGIVAISTWDLECPHQTFLSMYSVNEEEMIIQNSRTIREMENLFADVGFVDIASVKLGLVPDTISYDLGIEDLDIDGLRRLLEIDMAARASTPSKHGQMFISYGYVPEAVI